MATLTIGISNVFGCTLLGLLAKFPATYTNAAMSSQGLAGILPSLADVLSSTLVSPNPKLDAIVYFAFVVFALIVAILFYVLLYNRVSFFTVWGENFF